MGTEGRWERTRGPDQPSWLRCSPKAEHGVLCSVHPESGRYGSLCTLRQRPGLAGRTPAREEAGALPQALAFPADRELVMFLLSVGFCFLGCEIRGWAPGALSSLFQKASPLRYWKYRTAPAL